MDETQGTKREQANGNKGLWGKFVTFLTMGGFFLILLLLGAIAIAITKLVE